MSDYTTCPCCKGNGIVPLEEARRYEMHADADHETQREVQREREASMVQSNLDARIAAAEDRMRRLSGGAR